MKKIKSLTVMWPGALIMFIERLFLPRKSVALANSLALMNEHGIESLIVDPASSALPFSSRYLLIQRGASGAQYGDVCAVSTYPLGICSDSPYQIGDILNVRRLGARPGLEIGILTGSATIDHLLVGVAGGKVQDLTTVTANGTYWVVGRAAATVASTNSVAEIAFVPCVPYEITVSNGGGTYAFAGAGV